jgi:hypothetical protein
LSTSPQASPPSISAENGTGLYRAILYGGGAIRLRSAVMEHEDFDRSRAAALARQVGVDFGAALTVALAYIGDGWGFSV